MKMASTPRWRLVTLIVLSAVLYFFVNIQRSAVPGALFNQLQAEFGLTPLGVAVLGSGFTYVYAAAQLAVGFLIGKFGWVKAVRVGGFLFVAGTVLFRLPETIHLLTAAVSLPDLAQGVFI